MKNLETGRLILRKFEESDFSAVHSYSSVILNTVYMLWGPNTEEQTRGFIKNAIFEANKAPCTDYQYAVTLKESGKLLGGGNICLTGREEAEVGWILHHDYWKQGFGAEIGNALLKFGFEDLGLHRIVAHCDAENYGSFRVMDKIGMRREGLFIEGRAANKLSDKKYSDELSYAMLKDEWHIKKEIAYYNARPYIFEKFLDNFPKLSDTEIQLICTGKKPAIPEKKYVPAYNFSICKGSEKIGEIELRIGYTEGLYYGGQIGYSINEKHRGRGYAASACRLLLPVAKCHGMKKLLITSDYKNISSRRVCEKLGAQLIRVARLPEWHELYKEGLKFVNIFELPVL